MIQIQGLLSPCPTMRCTESLRFGSRFKGGTVFPDRVRSIKYVVLSLGAFEKVKLHEPWYLVEMAVSRHPDLLECCCGPVSDVQSVLCDRSQIHITRWKQYKSTRTDCRSSVKSFMPNAVTLPLNHVVASSLRRHLNDHR